MLNCYDKYCADCPPNDITAFIRGHSSLYSKESIKEVKLSSDKRYVVSSDASNALLSNALL